MARTYLQPRPSVRCGSRPSRAASVVAATVVAAAAGSLTSGCAQDATRGGPVAGKTVPKTEAAAKPGGTAAAFGERRNEREQLVQEVRSEGVDQPRVLAALARVPRHAFVPEASRGAAYANRPLPIGWGQTISQPLIVGMMSQAVAPKPTDRCLEIGTGSGYQAAVLAELCKETFSIEYLPELAAFGRRNLEGLGYKVQLRVGDGYAGWPQAAPFDVVVVTAAPEQVPQPLLDQLAVGGRLVIPVGPRDETQKLQLWLRNAPGSPEKFTTAWLSDVRFVPFVRSSDR